MDRRSFLRGSAGFAVAGVLAQLGIRRAGARSGPAAPLQAPQLPPASWPPQPGAFEGLTADWIIEENAKPGSSRWRIGSSEPAGVRASDGGAFPGIEGYLDVTSATLGQRVGFRVSSATPTYTIEAFRMGWYGGRGGRLVWQSGPLPGWRQGEPRIDPHTNMAEAGWDVTYELPLTSPFVPGAYLFRLTGADGASRLVPLTIRDEHSHAKYAVIDAVADWQAYNEWGWGSTYYGGLGRGRSYNRRARVVSFDRPYDWGFGAADFIGAELPLIMRMEEAGLDVTYLTSVDLHRDPERLLRHRCAISTAHDEYWSNEMRNAVEGARDKGVNIVFFGANAMYRQIRFEDSPHGKFRRAVCYKEEREDPVKDDSLKTINWRAEPVSRPEASIIGIQYDGQGFADLEVTHPDGWLWESTGVGRGHKFRGVIGPEFDKVFSSSPGNVQVFARSAIMEIRERESYADTAYYSAPSGAGVFATGTIGWISRLQPKSYAGEPMEPILYHATMNVLRLFGSGTAGSARPSIANAASARPSPLPKPKPKTPPRAPVPSPTATTTTTTTTLLPLP